MKQKASAYVVNQVIAIIKDSDSPLTVKEITEESAYKLTTIYVAVRELKEKGCVIDTQKYEDKKHLRTIALVPSYHENCEVCK